MKRSLALFLLLASPALANPPATQQPMLVGSRKAIKLENPANPAINTGSGTSFTFSSTAFGTNGPNRVLIIVVGFGTNQSSPTVTVSVGSGSPTAVVTKYQDSAGAPPDRAGCAIWKITGVTATTGTVTVTTSVAINAGRGVGITVFNLLGANSTEFATISDGSQSGTTALALSLNTPANGVVIGGAAAIANTSWTWANISEVRDSGVATTTFSAAGNVTAAPTTPLAATATVATGSNKCAVAASFQPL